MDRELSVGELVQLTGMTQPAASQHFHVSPGETDVDHADVHPADVHHAVRREEMLSPIGEIA